MVASSSFFPGKVAQPNKQVSAHQRGQRLELRAECVCAWPEEWCCSAKGSFWLFNDFSSLFRSRTRLLASLITSTSSIRLRTPPVLPSIARGISFCRIVLSFGMKRPCQPASRRHSKSDARRQPSDPLAAFSEPTSTPGVVSSKRRGGSSNDKAAEKSNLALICPECGHKPGQRSDLKRHLEEVHQGVKASQCPWCGKEFTRSSTLKVHLQDSIKGKVCQANIDTDGPRFPKVQDNAGGEAGSSTQPGTSGSFLLLGQNIEMLAQRVELLAQKVELLEQNCEQQKQNFERQKQRLLSHCEKQNGTLQEQRDVNQNLFTRVRELEHLLSPIKLVGMSPMSFNPAAVEAMPQQHNEFGREYTPVVDTASGNTVMTARTGAKTKSVTRPTASTSAQHQEGPALSDSGVVLSMIDAHADIVSAEDTAKGDDQITEEVRGINDYCDSLILHQVDETWSQFNFGNFDRRLSKIRACDSDQLQVQQHVSEEPERGTHWENKQRNLFH